MDPSNDSRLRIVDIEKMTHAEMVAASEALGKRIHSLISETEQKVNTLCARYGQRVKILVCFVDEDGNPIKRT